MAATFQRELFGGFTTEQLAAADVPRLHRHPGPSGTDAAGQPGNSRPTPATALFLSAWGHLHGLVILQVFGHTDFLGDHEAEIFRMAMRNMLQETHARIPR